LISTNKLSEIADAAATGLPHPFFWFSVSMWRRIAKQLLQGTAGGFFDHVSVNSRCEITSVDSNNRMG
jgi:hypothetical protein